MYDKTVIIDIDKLVAACYFSQNEKKSGSGKVLVDTNMDLYTQKCAIGTKFAIKRLNLKPNTYYNCLSKKCLSKINFHRLLKVIKVN